MAEIDEHITGLNNKLEAIDLLERQVQAELEEKQLDQSALKDAYDWEAAKGLREQMDAIVGEIEGNLFAMSLKLVELQSLSSQQQRLLKPEEASKANFRRVKLYLSPRIVLCLGRVGKMNLNSTISSGAHAWYAEEKAAHDKGVLRQGTLQEKEVE